MKQVVTARSDELHAPVLDGRAILEDRLIKAEARHRELDSRLKALGRRAHLTPAEHVEVIDLKKHKLKAKDEIEGLRRALL